MAASSYDDALKRVLVHEGGYSNHPSDPGGPTNWGITIHDARAHWKPDATAADVRAMPVAVAKQIYRSKYWDALRGDDLPAGVDYAVFDYGVNSGTGRAAKVLQRFVGVDADGEVGPATIAAAARADAAALIDRICDERLAFLQGLRTWNVFGKGWGRRVRDVRAAARERAIAAPASAALVQPASARESAVGELLRAVLTWFSKLPGGPVPAHASPPSLLAEPPWLAAARKDIGFHETGSNRGIERLIASARCGSEGEPSAGSGHVFFYVGENERGVLGLAGNQSDGVRCAYQDRARIVGYWWPKSAPLLRTGKIAVAASGAPVGGSET